ncbi:MAG: HEAT repeat domain-containing protein [bacterium]
MGDRSWCSLTAALLLWGGGMSPACGRDSARQPAVRSGAVRDAQPRAARPRPSGAEVSASEDAWRAAVDRLASCRLASESIERTCVAWAALKKRLKLLRRSGDPALQKRAQGWLVKLAKQRLGHERAPLRYWAAVTLRPAVHQEVGVLAAIFARARVEQEPTVLQALLYSVRSNWRKGPEYRALVLKMAAHEAAGVRREAVFGLGSMAGDRQALDLLIDRVHRDSDPGVRAAACKYAGEHGDERLLPVYSKYTADPGKDHGLYAACMFGLYELWNPFHGRKRLSGRAFALMLRVLRRTPYSHVHPPWALIDKLGRVPRLQLPAGKTRTPRWYRQAAVEQVLVGLVQAGTVHRFGRAGGIKALGKLNAVKALQGLDRLLGGRTDADSRYLRGMVKNQLARLTRVRPGE